MLIKGYKKYKIVRMGYVCLVTIYTKSMIMVTKVLKEEF